MDGWLLPDNLATEALDRLGLEPPVDQPGVDDLVEALGRQLPRGSTAKLAALEAGRRPSGHDPVEVVEGWLADPREAWTCWAAATVTASLVRAGGALDAQVMGVRRLGEGAPPVDIHSVVTVADGGSRWVCDPHFGVGPIPDEGGRRGRPALQGTLQRRPDGRFDWTVAGPSFSHAKLAYRSLTGRLDQEDVRMFCDVSVTHSGVQNRPFALLLLADGVGTLKAESWTGPAELRLWRSGSDAAWTEDDQPIEPARELLPTWSEGMDALHAAVAVPASHWLTRGGSPLR